MQIDEKTNAVLKKADFIRKNLRLAYGLPQGQPTDEEFQNIVADCNRLMRLQQLLTEDMLRETVYKWCPDVNKVFYKEKFTSELAVPMMELLKGLKEIEKG